MIVSAALLLFVAPATPVTLARDRFTHCLEDAMTAQLDAKVEPATFKTAFAAKCAAEETAYRTAMSAADRAAKVPAAQSAEDAASEVAYYREKYLADFADYASSGERPGKRR